MVNELQINALFRLQRYNYFCYHPFSRKIVADFWSFYFTQQKTLLLLQSDEVLKQAIGKDYLHGINRFHHVGVFCFS